MDISIKTPTNEVVTAPLTAWVKAILSILPPDPMRQIIAQIKEAQRPRIVIPNGIPMNGGLV